MYLLLIVDPDSLFLEDIEKELKTYDYRVTTASTGEVGLQQASDLHPDLIIMNIVLAGMSAYQLINALRKDSVTRDIPVMVLTEDKGKENLEKAMRYGIHDYLLRPYNPDNLNQRITAAIRDSEVRRKARAAEKSETIFVSISSDSVVVSFRERFAQKNVLDEAKVVFKQHFLKTIRDKDCVLDLRHLDFMSENDTRILEIILKLFGNMYLSIIAGRHYGAITMGLELDERVQLFISYADMEKYVQVRRDEARQRAEKERQESDERMRLEKEQKKAAGEQAKAEEELRAMETHGESPAEKPEG